MTIVLSNNAIMFLVFIIGMAIGAFFCWLLMKSKAEFEDDILIEYNHELLKLKIDYAMAKYEIEKSINKPPKPPHNPHK